MPKAVLVAIVAAIIILTAVFFWPEGSLPFMGSEKAEEFNITIVHTRYEPNIISVKQGSLVKLNLLTSEGTSSYMHGITIDDYGINELVTSETTPKVVTFKADRKGTLTAYCGTCAEGPFGREHPDIRLTMIVN